MIAFVVSAVWSRAADHTGLTQQMVTEDASEVHKIRVVNHRRFGWDLALAGSLVREFGLDNRRNHWVAGGLCRNSRGFL